MYISDIHYKEQSSERNDFSCHYINSIQCYMLSVFICVANVAFITLRYCFLELVDGTPN